ncbi:hypothetical protein [Microvirga yunnanensis]|uniref:hypothetical protein n=1 Tax=Microvirga yunnanensis TaxID=2953740 RepID=UPI0021C66CE3|nr:hypothetical protein [Microvirga sp. HBU65207]
MDLASMRKHGAHSVEAICQRHGCGHEAIVNVDGWPDDMPVPDVSLKLRYFRCGGKDIKTIPDWSHRRLLMGCGDAAGRSGSRTPLK